MTKKNQVTATSESRNNLEQVIGYQFMDQKLLDLALTHRSYLNEDSTNTSNERLEFLGDAVLELTVSEFLYHHRPDEPEGILTAARSAMVRTETLAEVARQLDLGSVLKMSRGEEKTGGRENESLLANTTEALVGAVYLDGGFAAAREFVARHLIPKADEVLSGSLKDPKSLLQEKVQELGFSAPTYQTLEAIGPDHSKMFVVAVSAMNQKQLAVGRGKNKQLAQQQAAKNALKKVAG
jgi:ribonuclease-3